MNDKELIELAAKAAGIKALRSPDGVLRDCTGGDPAMNIFAAKPWNPLTDDGDALRLAVKLRLRVFTPTTDTDVAIASCGDVRTTGYVHKYSEDEYSTDNITATRRAIVRAAAEIGRNMK